MEWNMIWSVKVIYHKALSIIENFFPDGEEVSLTRVCKTSWVIINTHKHLFIIIHPLVLKSFCSATRWSLPRLARPTSNSPPRRMLCLAMASSSRLVQLTRLVFVFIFSVLIKKHTSMIKLSTGGFWTSMLWSYRHDTVVDQWSNVRSNHWPIFLLWNVPL